MKEILNLNSSDTTLSNVIKKYPFYIDIKGSVSICLIKCAQEIETCNDVNLSIMRNEGKILLVKPSNKDVKCKINLAFDSNNDNHNNNGTGLYNFEQVFFTVPSLHRINGAQFDQETFIVFSSIQKNGTKLYCVLCTLNNSVDSAPTDPDKLINYKLLDELFSGTFEIPEKNSTKSLDLNVDLENFIPKKGSRNFYEYIHPKNPEVDFRIFQTHLDISSNAVNALKTKLTPSTIYSDFSEALKQNINPKEGLFIYYSQDVFNNYKSYYTNENDNNNNDKLEDFDQTDISEESKNEEEEFDVVDKLKKIKFEDKKKETFLSGNYKNKKIFKIDKTNLDVLESYENIDKLFEKNKDYDLKGIAEAIDDYPNIEYQGFYWRLRSKINLYKVDGDDDDTSDLYNLKIIEVKDNSPDQNELNNLLMKKTEQDKIINKEAMQNFPYKKSGDYYIQNIYEEIPNNFNKTLIIFLVWIIILCNYFFYRIIYFILNYNYDETLKINNNEIINNEVAQLLASNRLWVYVLIIINVIFSIICSIYISLGGKNIGLYSVIATLSFLTIFKIMVYIFNRRSYGSLNTLCNIEDTSLNLFLSQDINNEASFSNYSAFFRNATNLLMKSWSDAGNYTMYIPQCFNNKEENNMKGGSNEKHSPSYISPSKRESNSFIFNGLPFFPNKRSENNINTNSISVDKLTKDNDYTSHISDLYSNYNIIWIIVILILFFVIRYIIFSYFNKKFVALGELEEFAGIISIEYYLSLFCYLISCYVLLNQLICNIAYFFNYLYNSIFGESDNQKNKQEDSKIPSDESSENQVSENQVSENNSSIRQSSKEQKKNAYNKQNELRIERISTWVSVVFLILFLTFAVISTIFLLVYYSKQLSYPAVIIIIILLIFVLLLYGYCLMGIINKLIGLYKNHNLPVIPGLRGKNNNDNNINKGASYEDSTIRNIKPENTDTINKFNESGRKPVVVPNQRLNVENREETESVNSDIDSLGLNSLNNESNNSRDPLIMPSRNSERSPYIASEKQKKEENQKKEVNELPLAANNIGQENNQENNQENIEIYKKKLKELLHEINDSLGQKISTNKKKIELKNKYNNALSILIKLLSSGFIDQENLAKQLDELSKKIE